MYKCTYSEKINRTAVSILAAFTLSISISTASPAKSSSPRHQDLQQADKDLIAAFPFRKHKSETKEKSTDNADNDQAKSPASDASNAKGDGNPETKNDSTSTKTETESPSASKTETVTVTGGDSKSTEAKDANVEKSATSGTKENKEDVETATEKVTKKSDKKRKNEAKKKDKEQKDAAKKQNEEQRNAAKKQDEDRKNAAKKQDSDRKNAGKKQNEDRESATSNQAAEQVNAPASIKQAKADYKADSALLSLLKDLARAMNDPAEQAKLGDDNQKFVVQMALDVLNKALDNRSDANRIVDKKSFAGNSMSAEAWSSGDVKVSNDCRGSLAAVWAKKENGLLNVTIAGYCKDKVAPGGKNVGEYVVVLSARSAVQKGFDIQTQSDVDFWLAKLVSVTVDASCCNTESGAGEKTSSTESDQQKSDQIKELNKNSTVVLQAIMTERERLFNEQKVGEPAIQAPKEASSRPEGVADKEAKETANQKRLESDQKKKLEAEQKRLEAEKKQKQKEEERRLEAENKRKFEEEERKTEAEIRRKMEEQDRLAAAEEKRKKEEKIQLAQAEKMRKESEKQQKESEKQQKENEKLLKEDEKQQKADAKDRKNSHLTRDDAILAEAARQVELEQKQGLTGLDPADQMTGEQMTRADAILAEATRQAEAERREAADMRMPYGSSGGENNAIMPSVQIDNQPTALRPTPKISDLIGSADLSNTQPMMLTVDGSRDDNGDRDKKKERDGDGNGDTQNDGATRHNAMDYPTPPIEAQSSPARTLIAEREAAKGWDSPGLPANVKEPANGSHMVLPNRVIAGQHITASVLDANQNGESGIELAFNGVRLATDAQGKVSFMVPEDAVPGNSLTVTMVGGSPNRPTQLEVLQPLTTSSQQEAPSVDRASNMVSTNGTIVLDGHNFDGIADHNKVLIDENTECKVTAASPVQLRATVPDTLVPGVHFATVRLKDSKSNPGRFDLIKTEVRPDPKEAEREQETKLLIKVTGTSNPVQIHLTNQSPDVIKISKGNDFSLTTSGGDNNSTSVAVQRLRKGSYRVDAVIE